MVPRSGVGLATKELSGRKFRGIFGVLLGSLNATLR
ncbi:hypothetical protein OEIGOIKO_00207 [Streptomyces chrestomyceticus JCM 4735]|uniref:Uncharacterized protein n=1 Tax=Streptomyces chrestomyceticus JCM 4735 TaxID=1306181 RepID=A0A7U9KQ26_9ACTN|nr:hypothetical protein OEIGOIKO_00207 [Streptomyces chrestomyceticus JCM 4735]